MQVKISEVTAKSVLSRSGIDEVDYCLNPYTGCFHACSYCYATFMKRFSGHAEPWGSFVDVKINAPVILKKQLRKLTKGHIIISSVTDPYQPIESRYKITRQCLEVLSGHELSVSVLTKSPLVLRDIDLFRKFKDISIGLTVTTDDDRVRKLYAPKAPPINARIRALRKLKEEGISTYAFIGPVLPMDPEALARMIGPFIDDVRIDRMNYLDKTKRIYEKNGLMKWLDGDISLNVVDRLRHALSQYIRPY